MSQSNKKLLEAIKDVSADTGNWGEYGGQNKQSQIDAANECEKICLQAQIDLLGNLTMNTDGNFEDFLTSLFASVKTKTKELEEQLKQLNQ